MNAKIQTDLDTLLTHSTWVRGLAESLVLDAQEADDVVQETWLAALSSPPRDRRHLKAWLGTVVRNVVRMRRRKSKTRTHHERASRSELVAESVAEVQARVELQRELSQMLLELRSSYRSVLMLGYAEGLGPAEIARRLDTPIATVKSWRQRGLAELRARLESRYGDAASWSAALLPLAKLPMASSLVGKALGVGAAATGRFLAFTHSCKAKLGEWTMIKLLGLAAVGMLSLPFIPSLERPTPEGAQDAEPSPIGQGPSFSLDEAPPEESALIASRTEERDEFSLVFSTDGRPVVGARVRAVDITRGTRHEFESDDQGVIELPSDSSFLAVVEHDGVLNRVVGVRGGETVALRPCTHVRVQLRRVDGAPVEGVGFDLQSPEKPEPRIQVGRTSVASAVDFAHRLITQEAPDLHPPEMRKSWRTLHAARRSTPRWRGWPEHLDTPIVSDAAGRIDLHLPPGEGYRLVCTTGHAVALPDLASIVEGWREHQMEIMQPSPLTHLEMFAVTDEGPQDIVIEVAPHTTLTGRLDVGTVGEVRDFSAWLVHREIDDRGRGYDTAERILDAGGDVRLDELHPGAKKFVARWIEVVGGEHHLFDVERSLVLEPGSNTLGALGVEGREPYRLSVEIVNEEGIALTRRELFGSRRPDENSELRSGGREAPDGVLPDRETPVRLSNGRPDWGEVRVSYSWYGSQERMVASAMVQPGIPLWLHGAGEGGEWTAGCTFPEGFMPGWRVFQPHETIQPDDDRHLRVRCTAVPLVAATFRVDGWDGHAAVDLTVLLKNVESGRSASVHLRSGRAGDVSIPAGEYEGVTIPRQPSSAPNRCWAGTVHVFDGAHITLPLKQGTSIEGTLTDAPEDRRRDKGVPLSFRFSPWETKVGIGTDGFFWVDQEGRFEGHGLPPNTELFWSPRAKGEVTRTAGPGQTVRATLHWEE